MDHPLLVLSKVTEEDGADDKLLDADGQAAEQAVSLRDMIAKYAGGVGKKALNGGSNGDAAEEDEGAEGEGGGDAYALKVLKEIEEADGTSECMICTSEIFDEVLLPCYHRG